MIHTKNTITFCSLMMLSVSAMATNIMDEKDNIPTQQNQSSASPVSLEKHPGEEDFEQAIKHRNEWTAQEGQNSWKYKEYLRLLCESAKKNYGPAQARLTESYIRNGNYERAFEWMFEMLQFNHEDYNKAVFTFCSKHQLLEKAVSKESKLDDWFKCMSQILQSDNKENIEKILNIHIKNNLTEKFFTQNIDISDWFSSDKLASNLQLKTIHDEYQALSKMLQQLDEYRNQAEEIIKLQDQNNYKEMFESALNTVTQMNDMSNKTMDDYAKKENKNHLSLKSQSDFMNEIRSLRSPIIEIIALNCIKGRVEESNKDKIIEFLEKNKNIVFSDKWNSSYIKGEIYLGLNNFESAFQIFKTMHENNFKYAISKIYPGYQRMFNLDFLESELFLKTQKQALEQALKGDHKLMDMIDLTIMHENHSYYKGKDEDRYKIIKQQWYQDIEKLDYQSIEKKRKLEKQQFVDNLEKLRASNHFLNSLS